MSYQINIHDEGGFGIIDESNTIRIITSILEDCDCNSALVNVVYFNNEDIHKMNKKYLDHDYPTDVITFTLDDKELEGEIYIGVETAKENAKKYGEKLDKELLRLAAHGTLHLMKEEDSTDEERERMHKLENKYLNLINE
jgi:probable rRNA maturation factor